MILDVKSGLVVDEFQKFVQPTENPKLSDFCKSLTGITQVWSCYFDICYNICIDKNHTKLLQSFET